MKEKIDIIDPSNENMGYAKISKDKFRSFGKGNLELTRNAIDLILGVTKYVDSTSRIVIDLEMLSRKMNMQRKTYKHVLSQLFFYRLIYKKDGAYYSNFHIISKGNSSTLEYISPLEEFTSATFLNLTLNQKRLLTFFITGARLGSPQVFNVVKLYKNKIQGTGVSYVQQGIDIFPTLRELLVNLSVLVKNDQIEIVLRTESNQMIKLNSDSESDVEAILLNHFGFSGNKSRPRTTLLKVANELIDIRISKRLYTQKETVIASEYEVDQFALANNFSAYHLGAKQLNYLIGVKNELIKAAGDTGAVIYRRMLKKYFNEKRELIISYAENDKATNYFVDYYLLPEIRSILSDAALHQNIMSTFNNKFTEILTNGYIMPIKHITGLVSFYIDKSSNNHLAQLDKDLFKHAINISTFAGAEWKLFKEKIERIKYNFKLLITELPHEKQIDLFYFCADKYLLTKDDQITKLSSLFATKDNLEVLRGDLHSGTANQQNEVSLETNNRTKPIKFYNWLEERE